MSKSTLRSNILRDACSSLCNYYPEDEKIIHVTRRWEKHLSKSSLTEDFCPWHYELII